MSDIELQRLKAQRFKANNGRVIRSINILRTKYNRLTDVQTLLAEGGIAEDEFVDSINFLSEESYIHIRNCLTKEDTEIADCDYALCESKVTSKGIRLLAGGITDNLVEV